MSHIIKSRRKKAGLPPGSLVYVGERAGNPTRISIFSYDRNTLEEIVPKSADECAAYRNRAGVNWINVDGVHDSQLISAFGRNFEIHPLVLEDIMNTGQRPKKFKSADYLYIVLKMIYPGAQEGMQIEQVSLVLGRNFLISLQEEVGNDCFDRVRASLRQQDSLLRSAGPDYLAYLLIDTVVDNYFLVLEQLGEKLERLELAITRTPDSSILGEVHALKREMLALRRAIWPLREVVSALERDESGLIMSGTLPYFRDVYDHVVEAIEIAEMLREMASSLIEVYLSSVNNRISEVMKVLAMVATLFMPLTLITGIYGMNFEFMPELKWQYGYPAILALLLLVAVVMLSFFRRKNWL